MPHTGKRSYFFQSHYHMISNRYDAAVLVSLKGPVDLETDPLFPRVHKPTNKAYMFVDNAKECADPSTLFRSVVNVMLFMVEHIENNKDPEAMGEKVSAAIKRANELQVGFNYKTISGLLL